MSSSNCCFLTCIQISQEVDQVVWFPSLSEFSRVCCGPHCQGFGIVNKAEVHIFLELPCFLMIQWMLAIWSLVPLPFLKPAWTFGSSRFTYCWSLACRILSMTLLECEMSAIVQSFEHSLALPFFGIGMKTDLFQSSTHTHTHTYKYMHTLSLHHHLYCRPTPHLLTLQYKSKTKDHSWLWGKGLEVFMFASSFCVQLLNSSLASTEVFIVSIVLASSFKTSLFPSREV